MKNHSFEGIGKPEQLKYDLTGKWSRRINNEHRIVYTVTGDIINICLSIILFIETEFSKAV